MPDRPKRPPVPLAAASLASEAIREFEINGFALVPRLLSADEIAHYGDAVDRAVADRTRSDPRPLTQKTRYEQSFQQCLNLWEDHDDVRPLSFHPRIGEAAARLLGAHAVRIWHDQALYKEPGGRVTDPHQDQPYWPIREPRTVTAWIPFQDVHRGNGAMGYLSGSHISGLRKFSNIFSGTGFDVDQLPEVRDLETRFVDVPAGTVAFHHGLTVHRALPNDGERTRRVHTVIFFADGCTRTEQRHPSVDRPSIAVGAKIESDLTPIAWPRNGDLPAPPPLPNPPIPGWAGWRREDSGTKP
ncbi:MAG: phytanoyl-CoA dioxygenase family protein [Myxococcota bacterium]